MFPKKSYMISSVSFMAWFRCTSFSVINFQDCLTYILDSSYECHTAGCFPFHVLNISNVMAVLIGQSEVEALTFIQMSSFCMVVDI